LASILKLRESTRDQRLAQLAEALAAADKLRARREQILADLAQVNRLQHGRMATGQINLDLLLGSSRYDAIMRAELAAIAAHESTLAEEIERRQQAVLAADREVRMLEKLRDKQRELHQAAQALAEMKELDEIAARQSWRHAHDPDEAQGFGEGRR
jgi:flagellar export protein FliJ